MSDAPMNGELYIGSGVIATGAATVPGKAVVNGQFEGVLIASEIDIQVQGIVSGTSNASGIAVDGKLNDKITASDTLVIGRTGMVKGDISYGKLEVAKGGELLGVMKQI